MASTSSTGAVRVRQVTRRVLEAVLGPETFGQLLYQHRPRASGLQWGGPFNGQSGRCAIFAALVDRLRPSAIIETGTFRGATTEWMSAFQVPVYSIEADRVSYGFARARLNRARNVELTLGDSRNGLHALMKGPLAAGADAAPLVYLDAHWQDDLPLADELEIIYSAMPQAVVMIDDFQVPDDPDYGYDDYGPGRGLTPAYVAPAMRRFGLGLYAPARPGREETGRRRGCGVLANLALHAATLATISELRLSPTEQAL